MTTPATQTDSTFNATADINFILIVLIIVATIYRTEMVTSTQDGTFFLPSIESYLVEYT